MKQQATPRAKQHRPAVSLRISRPFIARLDKIAGRLRISRSELINRVLREYLDERGRKGIEALRKQDESFENEIDLFA